jgi:hypothetical protein
MIRQLLRSIGVASVLLDLEILRVGRISLNAPRTAIFLQDRDDAILPIHPIDHIRGKDGALESNSENGSMRKQASPTFGSNDAEPSSLLYPRLLVEENEGTVTIQEQSLGARGAPLRMVRAAVPRSAEGRALLLRSLPLGIRARRQEEPEEVSAKGIARASRCFITSG